MDTSAAHLSSLIALPGGAQVSYETAAKAAALCGADAYRLGLLLKGTCLTTLARGETSGVEAAARFLREAGVRCAAISSEEVGSVSRPALAGGTASKDGAVSLRVHGRPAGPPAGVPLLLVLGDLARTGEEPSSQHPHVAADTLSQRVLRAGQPVLEVVWATGRIRVALRSMTWSGLPGRGLSGPGNFLRLIQALVKQSGGSVLDLGFEGQRLAGPSVTGLLEPVEGADRETVACFDRYTATAAAAWAGGLYPQAAAGAVALTGGGLSSDSVERLFAPPPKSQPASPIPWIRRAGRSKTRLAVWPWLFGAPFLLIYFAGRSVGSHGIALAFAACGLAGAGVGVSALIRRERVRSVPQARVRSMALGPVELQGRVHGCATFTAPYSRTPCVWYRFELRQRNQDDEARGFSRATETGSSGDVPFWLDDGTGSVLVQPAEAEVDVEAQETPIGPGLRAVEFVLAEGEAVFVAGFAQRRSTDRIDPPRASATASRDDVFVGSALGQPFVISRRSRSQENAMLGREFLLGGMIGLVYLVVALLIFLSAVS